MVMVFTPCVLWWWVWCMGLWLWSSHVWHGATVAVNAPCVSWSQSSCPVCCGGGCGAWGCSCSLCAVCVVVAGVAHQVTVVVFMCVLLLMCCVCHSCGLHAMCVTVAVFVPCVLWSWV